MFLHLGCLKEMLMVTYSRKCNTHEWALGVISMYHVYSREKGGGKGGANMMVSFLLFVQHFVFAFFFSFSEAGF